MQYDIVISGGGLVGATLACLLADAGKRVAVLEAAAALNVPVFDPGSDFSLRVSALSRASQRVLQQIGVWEGVQALRCQPYESMVVWDAGGKGEISFRAAELGEAELGHIVENDVVQHVLLERIRSHPLIDWYCPARLLAFSRTSTGLELTVSEAGQVLHTGLLVGADGANSVVRELAGIGWEQQAYGQRGLVCVVKTALTHQQTAWQRFLPGGPLAFLPLSDPHYSSIVWTLPADRADRCLRLRDADFLRELGTAFDQRLGAVEWCSQRAAFPLAGATATDYVQDQLVLVGDAAHTIHPLAGQGVNLGLKDALVLSELLSTLPAGPVSYRQLRRYERARCGDNLLTRKGMEAFNLLFSNEVAPLALLRNIGLSSVNKAGMVKHLLVRRAMGL